jgi:archaellin
MLRVLTHQNLISKKVIKHLNKPLKNKYKNDFSVTGQKKLTQKNNIHNYLSLKKTTPAQKQFGNKIFDQLTKIKAKVKPRQGQSYRTFGEEGETV